MPPFSNLDGRLRDYLVKLTRVIEAEMHPVSKRFESFEKTISILESIRNKIPEESYLSLQAEVEWVRAKRLLVSYHEHVVYPLTFSLCSRRRRSRWEMSGRRGSQRLSSRIRS